MLISLYKTKFVTTPQVTDLAWPDFVQRLGAFRQHAYAAKEACPLFSPGELMTGKEREKRNVVRVHFGVIDLDHKTPEEIAALHEALKQSGLSFVLYSTWSHLSEEKDGLCACRLVVPFTRAVEGREWHAFWPQFNAAFGTAGDEQCKDSSRMYFVPSAPEGTDDEDRIWEFELNGSMVDVDALMVNAKKNPAPVPASSRDRVTIETLSDLLKRLNKNSKTAKWDWFKKKLKALIGGESLADDGDRDTTNWRMAKDFAVLLPNADPVSLSRLFIPSLKSMSSDPADEDWVDDVQEKIERAQDEVVAEKVEQKEAADVLVQNNIRIAFGTDRCTPYTTAELQGFAEMHGVTPDRLRDLWIIQKGDSYYFFVDGRYEGPKTKEEVEKAAQVYLAPASSAGVILERMTAKGEMTPKDAKQLVRDYGSLAREVHADMVAQVSRYDITKARLIEAPCPLRPLEPTYSEPVAKWLGLWPNQDKLLDVLASMTRLDVPCAAIYVQGAKGAGKTMLAEGIARLWTDTAATQLDDALSSWNNTITKCPLVFGDEVVPKDFRGNVKTAELRQFIQARSRTLKRKYLSDANFNGCIRLYLAANNPNMLDSSDTLTANDIEAIVDRFLYVEVKQAVADYLRSLPKAVRATFVQGDAIAKHLLWLRDNHTVQGEHRFIVEGDRGELHRALTTNTGLRSAVCNWLVSYLLDPSAMDSQGMQLVRILNGELLVTSRGLAKFWQLYTTNVHPPAAGPLSKALAGLSKNERRQLVVGNSRVDYRVIDIDNLVAWAHENGFADRETIESALRKPTPIR